MQLDESTKVIKDISGSRILNSHLDFTNGFIVLLDNDNAGVGSSSQGETISIFEDRTTRADARG